MERITITEDVTICNDYCHKCRTASLVFTGRVDKRECAHMACSTCGSKELRKAYKTAAGPQHAEQGHG